MHRAMLRDFVKDRFRPIDTRRGSREFGECTDRAIAIWRSRRLVKRSANGTVLNQLLSDLGCGQSKGTTGGGNFHNS